MNKNILAFLIPLITLSVIAFTPILDGPLSNLKFKVNLTENKIIGNIVNIDKTKTDLNSAFKKDVDYYIYTISQNFKGNAKTHAINYIYYANQRALVLGKISLVDNKKGAVQEILRFDRLMKIEFQAILDLNSNHDINLIDLYKDKREINDNLSKITYALILNNKDKYKLEDYMGDDINYTASTKRVF